MTPCFLFHNYTLPSTCFTFYHSLDTIVPTLAVEFPGEVNMTAIRKVQHIIEPQQVIEGAGVRLRRSFAPNPANPFDPFLLFDHFAFKDPLQGPIVGFPMHPHRGIETVPLCL